MMWHFHASHNPDNPVFSFGVASGIARHFHPPMLRLLNVVATTGKDGNAPASGPWFD
jgi:hypothetical protein